LKPTRALVHGRGSLLIQALGPADAEHRLQREIEGVLAGSRISVTEIRRTGETPGLVEEFLVVFTLSTELLLPLEAVSSARAAIAAARRAVRGSRIERTEWIRAELLPGGPAPQSAEPELA